MAELSRSESSQMRSIGRETARKVAAIAREAAMEVGMSRDFATVARVNADGTVQVNFGSSGHAMTVGSIRTTVDCASVNVGDVVVVDTYAHVPLVTGIVSTANNSPWNWISRKLHGWSLYDDNGAGWHVHTNGALMFVCANGVTTGSGSWDSTKCPYVLPEAYRPRNHSMIVPLITNNGGSWTGVLEVTTDGSIIVRNQGNAGSSDYRYGYAMWFVGL